MKKILAILSVAATFILAGCSPYTLVCSETYNNADLGYYMPWDTIRKMSIIGKIPGLTPDMLDAIVARMAEYGIFSRRRLRDTDPVLTSADLQRRHIRRIGLARARRITSSGPMAHQSTLVLPASAMSIILRINIFVRHKIKYKIPNNHE